MRRLCSIVSQGSLQDTRTHLTPKSARPIELPLPALPPLLPPLYMNSAIPALTSATTAYLYGLNFLR